jgi:hypothetical protein
MAIERPVGYSVGMTRRRLILAACVAAVGLGAERLGAAGEPAELSLQTAVDTAAKCA